MVGQGHFCKPIIFFGRSYLPFINGGSTLNNRSLLTSMTVCIDSCGTGDISSSIVKMSSVWVASFRTQGSSWLLGSRGAIQDGFPKLSFEQ